MPLRSLTTRLLFWPILGRRLSRSLALFARLATTITSAQVRFEWAEKKKIARLATDVGLVFRRQESGNQTLS
jgi:hypothetical protein